MRGDKRGANRTGSSILLLVLSLIFAALLYLRISGGSEITTPSAQVTNTLSPSPAPVQTQEPTPDPTPEPTPEPTPYRPDIDYDSWEVRLVNTDNLLEGTYEPELAMIENGLYFDARASEALTGFIAAAREAGMSVYLASAYRSYATQEVLFARKLNEFKYSGYADDAAEAAAKRIVTYPGASEHQLGLAADITDRYYTAMGESISETETAKWLLAHCAEHGFILRYPKDKQEITGIMFEPWHFRYVGKTAAEFIMQENLCLEEFDIRQK